MRMNQKELVDQLAHDLRTPLAVVKVNLELALLDGGNFDHVERIRSSMEELDRMIKVIANFEKQLRPV
jgi:signal transduction histidine kinase